MRCSLHFLCVVASFWDISAELLRGKTAASHARHAPRAYRQQMTNTGDAQYTGMIKVGGQQLNAVMDTGSFELLVLSASCSVCGKTLSYLYNESASKSHSGTEFSMEHSFGSGTTTSLEAYDSLEIANSKVEKQVFWEVHDANMGILLEDSFQAILGIGPPSSALKFAQEDVDEIHDEFEEFKKSGNQISDKIKQTVQHYEDVLVHAENATSVVENLEMENLSVCLGKKSLSPGYMVWNDHATWTHPEKFVQVGVFGDYYWSAKMTDAKLGAGFDEQKEHALGCNSEGCTAVIDTGTTLIVAPGDVVDKVDQIIQDWMTKGGSCDDLSKLPDLYFTLDGHSFSLPPESYVGRVEGVLSTAAAKYLPHIFARQRNKEQHWGGDCESLLMKMELDSQSGPMWILGMPLFRKYYTGFQFKQSPKNGPQAKAMYFAIADDTCQPSTAADAAAAERLMRTKTRKAELIVNASKIRMPRFVHRAVEANRFSKLAPGKPFLRV